MGGVTVEMIIATALVSLIGALMLAVITWIGRKLDDYGNRISRLEAKLEIVLGHVDGTSLKTHGGF